MGRRFLDGQRLLTQAALRLTLEFETRWVISADCRREGKEHVQETLHALCCCEPGFHRMDRDIRNVVT